MRDVFTEYQQGKLSWDEAYLIANNNAASLSSNPEEIEYWTEQMESLGVDVADSIMKSFGYIEDEDGILTKPSSDNTFS